MNRGGRLTLNSLDRGPLHRFLWDHRQSFTHSKKVIPTNLLEGDVAVFPGGKQFQETYNKSVEQNLADLPGVPGLGQQVISYLRQECACARWCCLPPPLTPELGPSVAVPMRPQTPCRQSHLQGAVAGHLTDRGCCLCYFIVILLAMPCGTWGLSSLTRD